MHFLSKCTTAFLAAVILSSASLGHYPVCTQNARNKAPSVRSFSQRILTKCTNPSDNTFGTLCYSKTDRQLLRDGEAVFGEQFSGFRVVDGSLQIKASETVRSGEKTDKEYLTLEEAAPLIGLETCETETGIYVSDPFRSGTLIVKAAELSDTFGGSEIADEWNDLHVLQYPTAADAYAAYQAYQADETVIFAEPNRVYHITADPSSSGSYPFPTDNWGWSAVGADSFLTQYAEIGASAPEVKVAVIDTGIYPEHHWFENRIAEGGASFVDESNGSYEDLNGHGTHCSGIICGMSPENVKILPLKVLNAQGYGTELGIYCAMHYAAEQDADIASMSFGGLGVSPLLEEGMRVMLEKDTVCIVAAGNDSHNAKYDNPANIPDVITVSSVCDHYIDYSLYNFRDTQTNDERNRKAPYWLSAFSNYGALIDFAAPGDVIYSAATESPDSVAALSGTSMACPHVAGCAADILSVRNDFSRDEVYECLKAGAIDLGETGFDEKYGWGLVNIANLDFNSSDLPHPEASVKSGKYKDVFTVTLSAAEPDSEIRYTTDGTLPEADSGILYQGEAILIDNITDLYAITVKDGKRSARGHWHYEFVTDPPVPNPDPGKYEEPVTVSFPEKYADHLYYTLDGSEPTPENWIQYTAPIEITDTTVIQAVVAVGKYISDPFHYLYMIGDQTLGDRMFSAKDGVLLHYDGYETNLNLNDYFAPGEITEIGEGVFRDDTNLNSIVLPDSVVKIGESAFQSCTNLRSVTATGTESIADFAFKNDNQLTQLDMPALKTIGNTAFSEALKPGTDPFGENNLIETIHNSAFSDSGICSAVFPHLKTLDSFSFFGCEYLTKAVLPESITVLPDYVFYDCKKLTTLDAPGVTTLGDSALYINTFGNTHILSQCSIDFSKLISIGDSSLIGFESQHFNCVTFDSLTQVKRLSFMNFQADEIHLPALKEIPQHAFAFTQSKRIYLDSAEILEMDALDASTNNGHITYIFGDHVAHGQKNPLNSNSEGMIIAAPADSPMSTFARTAHVDYYMTPDIYIPDGFDSCMQNTDVSLNDCYALAANSKVVFTAVKTNYLPGYEAPAEPFLLDTDGETLLLNTTAPGTVTLRADLVDHAGNILTSKTLDITIQAMEPVSSISSDSVFVLDWNQIGELTQLDDDDYALNGTASCIFTPEEDGEYYILPEDASVITKVFNDQNELLASIREWNYSDIPRESPIAMEAGKSYKIVAQISAHCSGSIPAYASGVRISKEKPTNNLLDITVRQKFTSKSELPDPNEIPVYFEGKNSILRANIDYKAVYAEEDDTVWLIVFGMGKYRGTKSCQLIGKPKPETIEEEYTFGETCNVPELLPGQKITYHVTNPALTKEEFVVMAGYSDAYRKAFSSGKKLPDDEETMPVIHVYNYDMDELEEFSLGQFASDSSVNDAGSFLFNEKVYSSAEISGNDFYITLENQSDSVTIPEGMYVLTARAVDRSKYLGYCTFEDRMLIYYNGKPQIPVTSLKIGDTKLVQGKDYEICANNDCVPSAFETQQPVIALVHGIGAYYGTFQVRYYIQLPALTTGPYAPETIHMDKPFKLDQYSKCFELHATNGYQCRLRKTNSPDPDSSYIYSVFRYDKIKKDWVAVHFAFGTETDPTLELEAGTYRFFIAQFDKETEFVVETMKQTMIGIEHAELHANILQYTGEELKPEITLTYQGETLKQGQDYMILLPNKPIKECGFYHMTLYGIGNFSGERTFCVIVKADEQSNLPELKTGNGTLENDTSFSAEWIPDQAHYGISMNENQLASLTIIDPELQKEILILDGQSYLYDFMDVTPGRTYLVYASWNDPTRTDPIHYTLLSDYIDLTACTVEGDTQGMFTQGNTMPAIRVKNGDDVLTEGVDYNILCYGGNNEPGHACISLIGTENSIGSLNFHYYLAPEPDPAAFEADTEMKDLKPGRTVTATIPMPGDMQRFRFCAPKDGQYSFERPDPKFSGINVFAYDPDMALLPPERSTIELKQGETLWFIAVGDHLNVCNDVPYTLTVYLDDVLTHTIQAAESEYLIREGKAYLNRYDGENIGIQLPETVYDPETDTNIPVAGYTEELLAELCTTRTFYCDKDCESYSFMLRTGICVAIPDPQTDCMGDITGDGIVNNNDYLTLIRWITECPGMLMSDSAFAAADLNQDGCLDLLDADAIRAIIAND